MKTINFKRETKKKIFNLNDISSINSFGKKASDFIASLIGSWKFIIVQSILLSFWITLNIVAWSNQWDPYPFILLNLFLSFQAAYTDPVVMMSQNRQEQKDRIKADHHYKTNKVIVEQNEEILECLEIQNDAFNKILRILENHK